MQERAEAAASPVQRPMPEPASGAGLNAAALQRLTAAMQALVDAGRLPGAVMHIERRGEVA